MKHMSYYLLFILLFTGCPDNDKATASDTTSVVTIKEIQKDSSKLYKMMDEFYADTLRVKRANELIKKKDEEKK